MTGSIFDTYEEPSEDEITEDQSSHYSALMALTTAYDIMNELNVKDHRIEQQIMMVMSLIQDKDGRTRL